MQRLGRRPVPAVPDPARRRPTTLVAKVLGQLGVHRPLNQPAGQLRQHAPRPDDLLLRPGAGEQLVDQLITETLPQLGRQPLDDQLGRRTAATLLARPTGSLRGTAARPSDPSLLCFVFVDMRLSSLMPTQILGQTPRRADVDHKGAVQRGVDPERCAAVRLC